MSFSQAYGEAKDAESLTVLAKAVEVGCTFWDTAAVYGMGHNESLIGDFFKQNPASREKVFIASKCGWDVSNQLDCARRAYVNMMISAQIDYKKKENKGVTNKAEHIKKTIDLTIKRLGTTPDLYYLHRIDPNTPFEESIGTMAAIKKEGKTKLYRD